jgi:hypothetical protein
MNRLDDYTLGTTNDRLVFGSSDEARDIALHMVRQCRRTLDIAARHLEPSMFEHADFIDAVRRLCLKNRHVRVRILVLQPEGLHRRGHALIDTAATLSSFIRVRVPGEEHREYNEALLIADEIGYMHRPQADRYEGHANFRDPPYVGGLVRRFDELWDRSDSDSNFRRLSV